MKIRWFVTYLMARVQRNSANRWQMLTNLSLSGRSTWCLVRDMFGHKSGMWMHGYYPTTHKLSRK